MGFQGVPGCTGGLQGGSGGFLDGFGGFWWGSGGLRGVPGGVSGGFPVLQTPPFDTRTVDIHTERNCGFSKLEKEYA